MKGFYSFQFPSLGLPFREYPERSGEMRDEVLVKKLGVLADVLFGLLLGAVVSLLLLSSWDWALAALVLMELVILAAVIVAVLRVVEE